MPLSIQLPNAGRYELQPKVDFSKLDSPLQSRVLYGAAHVVADLQGEIDWDATIDFRHHLWSWGLGVAEAMDTAQRGMGLSWDNTQGLIRRSLQAASESGGSIVCGVGTDQLTPPYKNYSLQDVIAAYQEQLQFVENHGGRAVLMASRALAALAKGPGDYHQVYDAVLQNAQSPVIIHWLGKMFDPALKGYWGATDFEAALATCVEMITRNQGHIEGIKMSLLDAQKEIVLRRQLPAAVKMFTGDDFNYPELIAGDQQGFSHALLGIFDGIAPAASAAVQQLDQGNEQQFHEILAPTVPLARHIFESPTRCYKTGIVFLAWLNGHQKYFSMVENMQTSRSREHLITLFTLADKAQALTDPPLAVERMEEFLKG